jgi:hypothetical protein
MFVLLLNVVSKILIFLIKNIKFYLAKLNINLILEYLFNTSKGEKYIKIICFIFKKLFFILTHQNDPKIYKK